MKLKLKAFRRKDLGKHTKSHNFLCPWEDRDPRTGQVKASGILKFSNIGQEEEVPDSVGHSILHRFSDILEIGGTSGPKVGGATKRVASPANK